MSTLTQNNLIALPGTPVAGQRVVKIAPGIWIPVGLGGSYAPPSSSDSSSQLLTIEAGYIDENGNFQPLSFEGTAASDSGSAISGLEHKIFNTGHEEPAYPSGGSSIEFYKCSYVNSDSWGGYKAVFNGTCYQFQSDSTQGLFYGSVRPIQTGIYSEQCNVKVSRLIPSSQIPTQDLVFYAPLSSSDSFVLIGAVNPQTYTLFAYFCQLQGVPCMLNENHVIGSNQAQASAFTAQFVKVNQSENYTLSCWFLYGLLYEYQSDFNVNQYFFGIGGEGNGNRLYFLTPSGSAKLSMNIGGTTYSSDIDVQKFKWYHLCLTKSGESLILYINGQQASTGTTTASSIQNKVGVFTRYDKYYSATTQTALAACRVYNRVLSIGQIQALSHQFSPMNTNRTYIR